MKVIDVHTAKNWVDQGEAVLIDVREPAEHASQKISGASLHPLGSICCAVLPQTEKKIVVHCRTGRRSASACEKLMAENGNLSVYNLEGGIEAWHNAGLPTESDGRNILPLDRQVQLTIGLSVLTFSLFAYFVHPSFALGSAFFGAGLANAGITGWCGLGKLMAKMPWNK